MRTDHAPRTTSTINPIPTPIPLKEPLVSTQLFGTQHEVSEWSYRSTQTYADAFNEVELDGLIAGPNGQTWRVPAYWAGGGEWRLRFAPPVPGEYTITTDCTDADNPSLHG